MPCAALPVSGRVSSPYGWRWLNGRDDLHTGVDIGAPEGTPVFALLAGLVVVAAPTGTLSGYGNVLVLQHAPALYSLYAHLSRLSVLEGQSVGTGAELGAVGRTAGTPAEPGKVFAQSNAHLHLELLSQWPPRGKDLDRLDPGAVLPALGIIVPSSGPLLQTAQCGGSSTEAAPARSRSSSSASGRGVAILALLGWLAYKSKRRAL